MSNPHFDQSGSSYKEITFYKLFDEETIRNNYFSEMPANFDLIQNKVRYIPKLEPGSNPYITLGNIQ